MENLNIKMESNQDGTAQSRTERLLRDVLADFVWVSEKRARPDGKWWNMVKSATELNPMCRTSA